MVPAGPARGVDRGEGRGTVHTRNGHKSAQEANTYVFCGAIPGSS